LRRSDTFAEPVKLNIKPGEHLLTHRSAARAAGEKPERRSEMAWRATTPEASSVRRKMNQRAMALGATHSHFVNPNGLPDARQFSTARDCRRSRGGICESHNSFDRLPASTCFRFATAVPRIGEHEQTFEATLPYCNGMKLAIPKPPANV